MTIANSMTKFLQDQTLSNFLEVRLKVVEYDDFNPYLNYENVVNNFFLREQFDEGIAALRNLLPGSVLSFGLHGLLAYAYGKIGATQEMQREIFIAQAVITALLSTGDGSQLHPYDVTQINDEYDILRYLGKKSKDQMLARSHDKVLDKHVCEDGSVVWFDITLPFALSTSV